MDTYQETQLSILNTLIKQARKSLASKPAGSLQIRTNKNSYQYYYAKPDTEKITYIRKKKMSFIRSLAQKQYDQKFLAAAEILRKEIPASSKYCGRSGMHAFYQYLASVYENLSPARQELVTLYVMPDEMFIQSWLAAEYTGKPFSENAPEITTENGERVRSKSENMIADRLLRLGIAYR